MDSGQLPDAGNAVAELRRFARRYPLDAGLQLVVGELMLRHPLFVALWNADNGDHDAAQ